MGERIPLIVEIRAILLEKDGDWEEKIASIGAMFKSHLYGNFTGYDIYFKGGNQKYFYPAHRVRILAKVGSFEFGQYEVYVDNVLVKPVKIDEFSHGYYRVYTPIKTYFTQRLRLEDNRYRKVYQYFRFLAKYAETIAEPETSLYYLSKNYGRLELQDTSVLKDYLRGSVTSWPLNGRALLPLDFNQSQIKAIESALQHNISIIEGPPGTGKTQTILNLIANIVYRGNNCAVVSNNNAAIENVYDKLDQEGIAFLCAPLGRRENVERFFEEDRKDELKEFLQTNRNVVRSDSMTYLSDLHDKIKQVQELEVKTSLLETELLKLKTEQRHHETLKYTSVEIDANLYSGMYLKLIARIQKPKRIGWIERLLLQRKYRMKFKKNALNDILSSLESLYYTKKIDEIKKDIAVNRHTISQNSMDQLVIDMKMLSTDMLHQRVAERYSNLGDVSFGKNNYKQDFMNFLMRYPVVLSTSQSLLNNARSMFLFDYLIIDEASQGDLLSSILAIGCAKNLVVVGDSRQLQQIEDSQLFDESIKLSQTMDIPKQYQYHANSILKSVRTAVPQAPVTLLREHYRCAPDIINFCNRMFYNNELVVMTKNQGTHIEIIKTVEGNHARKNPFGSGWYNQREIDEIKRIVDTSKSKDIGVITPFRYQANLIGETIKYDDLEADTVHKFQGRQKDEIVLSFVVNSLEKNENSGENRLYDFVANEKLLNVAISRGRKKVTAIVSDHVYQSKNNTIHDFIQYAEYLYGNSVTKESKITSIFDCLYSDLNETYLGDKKYKYGMNITENLLNEKIPGILSQYGYIGYSIHTRLSKLLHNLDGFNDEDKRYLLHPWTHVDFLFYHSVSHEPLFVVEVDGVKYHEQSEIQSKHDAIKDKAIEQNGIHVYRFKTNESREESRLKDILKLNTQQDSSDNP